MLTSVTNNILSSVVTEGSRFEVDEVKGSVFGDLLVTGMRISSSLDSTSVEVDSLQLSYSFWDVLRLKIASVKASSVHAQLSRNFNGDFILPTFTESEGEGSDIEIGTLSVGSLTTQIIQNDSLLAAIRQGQLEISTLRLGSVFAIQVDTVWANVWYPETESSGVFNGSLAYGDHLGLRTSLSLNTDLSQVELAGSFTRAVSENIEASGDSLSGFAAFYASIAQINATGNGHIATKDIAPFVHGITDQETFELKLETVKVGSQSTVSGTVSSQQSGSATISLTSNKVEESISHKLNLEVRDVNPGFVYPSVRSVSNVSGELEVDATGSTLDELVGTAVLRLKSGSFEEIQVRPSEINATLAGIQYTVNGGLSTSAGTLRLSGSYATDGQFSATGNFTGLDLSAISEGAESSSLNASFNASGLLSEPRESSGSVRLVVQPSKLSACAIDSGLITARLTNNRISYTADVALCAAAAFKSEGAIQQPFDDWLVSAKGSVEGLRVSELLGLDDPLELSSSFNVTATSSGKLNGELHANEIRVGEVQIDSVRSVFNGSLESLTIRPMIALGGGIISFDASIANSTHITVRSGSVSQLDVFSISNVGVISTDSLGSAQTYSSALNGTFSGVFNVLDAGFSGLFDLILEETAINQELFSGRTQIGIDPASITASIDLQAQTAPSNGSIQGNVDVQLTDQSLRSNLTLRNFDPLPVLQLEGKSALTGSLLASANWSEELEFDGSIALEEGSTFNQATFTSFNATASGSETLVTGVLDIVLGRGDVRAEYAWQHDTLDAQLQIDDADIAALLGIDAPSSLSAQLNVSANTADEVYSLRLAQLEGYFENITWNESNGSVLVSPTAITVDSLLIPGSFGRFFAHGTLPRQASAPDADLAIQLSLNHELSSLNVFKPFETNLSEFNLEGNLQGPSGAVRLISSFSARNLTTSSFSVDQLSGRILGELGDSLRFSAAELTSDLTLIEVPPSLAESGKLSLQYDGEELLTTLDINISDGRSFSTHVGWEPFIQPDLVSILNFTALIDGSQWSLTGVPVLNISELYLEKPLVLAAGDQRIVVVSTPSGTSDSGNSTYRNLVTVQQVNIDPFADILTYPELGGVLSGTLSSTTVEESMHLQGTLFGVLTAYHQPVGTLNTQFNFDGSTTRLSASLKDTNGESIQLSGSIPGFQTDEQVQIQLSATAYSIDWIRSLLDPGLIDALKGTVDGEVRISGTPKQPNWSGLLKISNGQIGLPELGKRRGMLVQSIQGNFRFDGEVIAVDSLRAKSGDGWMTGSGTIDIRDLKLGEYNISITANDFKAIDSPDYFGVVSGTMQLGGTTDRPRISGRVTVHRGDFWLSDATTSDAFEPLALSEQDLATLQRRFGLRVAATDTTSFDAYDVLTLENFTVRMERDTWIRSKSNPKLDIQLTGDLDVRKKPKEDPEVFGSITILPERSRIIQFGKRFEMERGELTFNGPMTTPNLNMEASYTVPSRGSETEEVTIRLLAQGTPDNLDVSFDSDPAMELADIISYIATGRPAAASLQISGAQSDTYLQSAAGLAMGPVTDLIENLAGAGLGLDVIEIEHTGFSGLTLTAGKYVSPRLYVSVSQPIALSASSEANNATNKNQTQVTIEYELVQQLLLSLLNRGTILRVNLRWQHAF